MDESKQDKPSTHEIHDSVAEQLIANDEIIKQISKTIKIKAIEIIQGEYSKVAIIKLSKRNNTRHWIRIVLLDCETPTEAVNVVRSTLQKLVTRPFPVEALRECSIDLTDRANGSEALPRASDDALLWEIARKRNEEEKILTHATYIFIKPKKNPSAQVIAKDLEAINRIESRINQRKEEGDEIIAYWWTLDDECIDTLHLIYAQQPAQREAKEYVDSENEEPIDFAVLREELFRAVKEEGLDTLVTITDNDDCRNGERLTSPDADEEDEDEENALVEKYNAPFGPNVPEIITSINGRVIEPLALSNFIEQIKKVLAQQKGNGETPGINIAIGYYYTNDESDDDYTGHQTTICWELACYARLPDLPEKGKRGILDTLIMKNYKLFDRVGEKILEAINITNPETVRKTKEIQYVEVRWCQTYHECPKDEDIQELGRVLQKVYENSKGKKLNVAILETFNNHDENTEQITLRIGISASDESYE